LKGSSGGGEFQSQSIVADNPAGQSYALRRHPRAHNVTGK
jgi:hypothetical protein